MQFNSDGSSLGGTGFSIKEVLRKRLMNDMIRLVQPASKWKILIVDPITMKILNSCLKMFDILDENVTLVELINRKRQPYPNLEAIYFISPTPESFAYFENDFCSSPTQTQYHAANLFFSNSIPDALMQKIKQSKAARFVKSLKELFVDYHAAESRFFEFGASASFFRLFSPNAGGIHIQNQELDRIAKKIACFALSMGDPPPYIRYHRPLQPESTYCGKLAHMVAAEFESLVKNGSWESISSDAPKGTLIIVDRTIDSIAPVVHEFTYQAMAYDLLQIEDDKYAYQAGNEGRKEAILDESDSIWVDFRHTHIADTSRIVTEQFNKFITENKAASNAVRKTDGASGTSSNINSLKAIKETLASMPQFQELKQKYTVHINMIQECMALFERRKIASTGALEQDMATGLTSEGNKPKGIVAEMVPLLDDPCVTEYDKVRLLMLYIIYKQGLEDEDRRKLLDHAHISLELAESITNLSQTGVKLSRSASEKRSKRISDIRKSLTKKSNSEGGGAAFELSRYRTQIRGVLDDYVSNSLSTDLFPYLGVQPSTDVSGGASAQKTGGTSLRSTKPSWQKKGPAAVERVAKTIVFVLGGVTYSEIRAAYEVSSSSSTPSREILIGSTHVVTPTKFINDLKDLRRPMAFENMEMNYGNGVGPVVESVGKTNASKKKNTSPGSTNDGDHMGSSNSTTPSKDKKEKKKGFLGIF